MAFSGGDPCHTPTPDLPPSSLPPNRPVPLDDGACDHLPGARLPSVALRSTAGRSVNLSDVRGTLVVFVYPHTGRPDTPTPKEWDLIPGARGCTPEACAYRDLHEELRGLGAEGVRRQHRPAGVATGGGQATPPPVRTPQRPGSIVVQTPPPADLYVPESDLLEASHARSRGQSCEEGVLPDLSAGPESGGRDQVLRFGAADGQVRGYDDFSASSLRSFETSPPASRISSTFGGSPVNRTISPDGRPTSPLAMSSSIISPE